MDCRISLSFTFLDVASNLHRVFLGGQSSPELSFRIHSIQNHISIMKIFWFYTIFKKLHVAPPHGIYTKLKMLTTSEEASNIRNYNYVRMCGSAVRPTTSVKLPEATGSLIIVSVSEFALHSISFIRTFGSRTSLSTLFNIVLNSM